MNTRPVTMQVLLNQTGHTLPTEWERLELEWAAATSSEQMCEHVGDDYGRWKLGELIDTHHMGHLQPHELTLLAKDLVVENEVLLLLIDAIDALNTDPSSISYHSEKLLKVMRPMSKARELPHTHLLRFAQECETFFEAGLSNGDLTLEATKAGVHERLIFTEMIANVLSAAEPEHRATRPGNISL